MKSKPTAATAVLLSFLCLVFLPLQLPSQTASPEPITVSHLIAEGNESSEKFFDHARALQKYSDALSLDPGNYEALWRTSRAYERLAEHLPATTDEEKKQQLALFEKALHYANKAVAANPKVTPAYTWRAIVKGRLALFRGFWEAIGLAKEIRADLSHATELDPSNDLAWYVFGRTHVKVSERPKLLRWPLGLSWANLDEAVRSYERAIALRPDFIMYRVDCARAYVELEEYDKARRHLSIVPSLPTQDEDDDRLREEANALMEKIKDLQ